jgi:hypothetical protein
LSSVIAIQTYDRVWIGADSAVSTQIGGNTYRLHEDGKKLFHIGDKVIFCSGIMDLAAAIMKEYEAAADHSLTKLQKIARRQCAEYTAKHPEVEERRDMFVELMIAYYDKGRGKTVVASISPYHNDFEIVERTLNSPMDFAVWAGGIRTQQATDAAMAKLRETLDVNLTYKYAFRAISYEGIGGNLTVYEVDAAGVRESLRHTIREKPGIKRLTRDVLQKAVAELVIAERIVGQQINGVGLSIGSGNNITYINPNGIAAGHANFNSAPFRVDMQGNLTANKLTANSAQINSSTWKDGVFSGNITATGTITGAHLVGGSITSDTDIDITRDIRVGNNIYLGLTGQTNDRRIEFVDSGPYRSYIGFTNSTKQLEVYAANDIRINSGLNVSLNAAYDINVNANRVIIPFNTYLGTASSSNRLVMQADLGGKANVEDAGYNLTFDSSTRNLKMYNRYGDLMAQVHIP